MKWISRVLAVVLPLAALADVNGDWNGVLDAGGQKLKLMFHIKGEQCSCDSISQGAKDIKGTVKSKKDEDVELVFDSIGAKFKGELADGKLEGKWSQGFFNTFPLTLSRGGVALNRPQEPKGPFPYRTEEVSFGHKDAKLSGTLTLPQGCAKGTPVVLMVTGSGPQNRDEELMGHRPFAVIADYLARRGVASLRYDDRGLGKSTGKVKDVSIEDIALDAAAGCDYLRTRFSRVGVIGHSEGGTIGFMLAQKGKVDYVVSLAGSAMKLSDVLDYQLSRQLRNAGKNELEIMVSVPLLKKQMINDDGVRRYMEYDPVEAIKASHCPVLALNGEKDVQVVAKEHMEILRKNLSPADKMKFKVYPGLNHLFQHCRTGEPTEYVEIEETIAPEVLSDIVTFIEAVRKR